ncbi:UNVERIFIED_CONTAM: hypothetical protein GTU68_043716 [Idotea baltica]|nr:hypothetical protein [Idotea baltica]
MPNIAFLKEAQQLASKFNAQLVAVSKTRTNDEILTVYNQGQKVFGENKVQDLTDKYNTLPKDIEWHMIGHLQTNKVKYIAPFVKLIHAVDSRKLLEEVNKRAKLCDRVIDCLLQFHIAAEDSKFGFSIVEAEELLGNQEINQLKNVRIIGVMGMATFTNDKVQIAQEFKKLKHIFDVLRVQFFLKESYFKDISMGMSGDYDIALENGSTLIRIGSKIFGNRVYN